MWLNKFLNVEEDIEKLSSNVTTNIFKKIKKKKLTPLEVTVLEAIFNVKTISGYDLIEILNTQFAKTWEAKSGTIYPILNKLENNGYLVSRKVKSPIGPIKSVYSLTDAGEQIIKSKISNLFMEQLKFIENFLGELSIAYIKSFPDESFEEKTTMIREVLKEMFHNIKNKIPKDVNFARFCPQCGSKIISKGADFCAFCGVDLSNKN
ncbi:MAG: helix-turn-helix transcriptional regulator [Candidatus Lokiarchaeota archaeon]|nr:helix-turn-helix transcriptional regulator [Candidatus Lokiarchaeota archaeon]